MSANTYFIDAASRHAIFIQRYANGLDNSQKKAMAKLFDKAQKVLDSYSLTNIGVADEARLYLELQELMGSSLKEQSDNIIGQLIRFAKSEAEFNLELFGSVVDADLQVPSVYEIEYSVIMRNFGFNSGLTIGSAFEQFGIKKARQAVQVIRDGILEGKTHSQLKQSFQSLFGLFAKQAGTIVRTGVNHVSTTVRMQTLEANKKIFDGYEWVSTLDSRTSLICASRDGVIYPFKPESPRPPAHFGCRSTLIPKVKSRYNLLRDVDGDRPSVGPDGPKQVSAKTTYSGWLRKQSAAFQDEVLGPTRGKLFRQGGLSLTHFVDERGEAYSLERLQSLRPLEFEKANLN